MGLLRTSLPVQIIVSPGLDACDSKKALMSGTYILKSSRPGFWTTTCERKRGEPNAG